MVIRKKIVLLTSFGKFLDFRHYNCKGTTFMRIGHKWQNGVIASYFSPFCSNSTIYSPVCQLAINNDVLTA